MGSKDQLYQHMFKRKREIRSGKNKHWQQRMIKGDYESNRRKAEDTLTVHRKKESLSECGN